MAWTPPNSTVWLLYGSTHFYPGVLYPPISYWQDGVLRIWPAECGSDGFGVKCIQKTWPNGYVECIGKRPILPFIVGGYTLSASFPYYLIYAYANQLYNVQIEIAKTVFRDYINLKTVETVNYINSLVAPVDIQSNLDNFDSKLAERFALYKSLVATSDSSDNWSYSDAAKSVYTPILDDANAMWLWWVNGPTRDQYCYGSLGCTYVTDDPTAAGDIRFEGVVIPRRVFSAYNTEMSQLYNGFFSYINTLLSSSITSVINAMNAASAAIAAAKSARCITRVAAAMRVMDADLATFSPYVDSATSEATSAINALVAPGVIESHLGDYDSLSAGILATYHFKVALPDATGNWGYSAEATARYTRIVTESQSRVLGSINAAGCQTQAEIDAASSSVTKKVTDAFASWGTLLTSSVTALSQALNAATAALIVAVNAAAAALIVAGSGALRVRVDSAKRVYKAAVDLFIDSTIANDMNAKVTAQVDPVLARVPLLVDSYTAQVVSISFMDSPNFRNQIRTISSDGVKVVDDGVAAAETVFNGISSYWLEGEPSLADSRLSSAFTEFSNTIGSYPDTVDNRAYVTSAVDEVNGYAGGKIRQLETFIESANLAFKQKVYDVRVAAYKKINDYIMGRPIVRLTGKFSIPVINWSGTSRLGVEVKNVGKVAWHGWFGWKFIDSSNKVYVYDPTPTIAPMVGAGETVMITVDVPFGTLFPYGPPGDLRARLIPTAGGG